MHNEFDGIDACVRYESKEPAKRAPRAMAVEIKFTVRNIVADSYEEAKSEAHAFASKELQWRHALRSYASKEADGTFTVEFR